MPSNNLYQFEVLEINSSSIHLKTIMKLADANAATLGFLPYGAFHRLADKGLILACIVPQVGCIGYLLYEISSNKVKLRHLCIAQKWRGNGVAKILIKYLKNKTYHLQGIQASCRRDYNLRGMWTALGFVAVYERPGRSKEGSILTEWWLDYGHPDLIKALAKKATDSKICATIDANIFYDIVDKETADEDSKESKALLADWVEPELELCLTEEIQNEIDRNNSGQKRKYLRGFLNRFTLLPSNQETFNEVCRALVKFFPKVLTESDTSDLRQLARVISSDIKVPFFVTRDKRLLEEIEEDIYTEFGLSIIHPIDLILKLDELRRENDYQPIKLVGTSIEKQRVLSGDQSTLIDLFLNRSQGERKIDFQRKIRQILSDPNHYECFTIGRKEETPIGLIAYERSNKSDLVVPIFRFRDTQLTPIILRHCIFDCFSKSANEGRQFTIINETRLSSQAISALQEDYFSKIDQKWLRINLNMVDETKKILSHIFHLNRNTNKVSDNIFCLSESLNNQNLVHNIKLSFELEKVLYPAKLTDAEIPCFIIPIQSWWAKDLFDKELAEQTLWGAKESLAFSREAVYYRSKQASGGLEAPGRILWYVSKSGSSDSCSTLGAIRACSRLEEIVIGKSVELHKRFRRLGVYSFKDVLKTANNDFNREIMAIRFSDTELFKKPVELKNIEQIMGRKISVRAPYKLTSQEFFSLYNHGIFTNLER